MDIPHLIQLVAELVDTIAKASLLVQAALVLLAGAVLVFTTDRLIGTIERVWRPRRKKARNAP